MPTSLLVPQVHSGIEKILQGEELLHVEEIGVAERFGQQLVLQVWGERREKVLQSNVLAGPGRRARRAGQKGEKGRAGGREGPGRRGRAVPCRAHRGAAPLPPSVPPGRGCRCRAAVPLRGEKHVGHRAGRARLCAARHGPARSPALKIRGTAISVPEEEEEDRNLPLPPRPLPGNAAARPIRPRMAQPQPAESPAPRTGPWVSATLPRRFLQLPCFRGYG